MSLGKFRGLLAVSCAFAVVALAACKKEETKPVEADAAPAIAAEPAAAAAGDNLTKAKALIDRMTGELEKMITEVEASGGDEAKVKAIGDKFKASADTMKTEGEELSKKLTEDEKKQVEAYGREKMTPLMGRLMGAMMKNRPMPPPAAATEGMAPAAPEGTGAAPAAPAPAPAPAP